MDVWNRYGKITLVGVIMIGLILMEVIFLCRNHLFVLVIPYPRIQQAPVLLGLTNVFLVQTRQTRRNNPTIIKQSFPKKPAYKGVFVV